MGNYGITGWSGGGRQSLTYNLKAGQFRGMGRVNVFPSRTTIINNNIIGSGYGMYDSHQCCNNSTPKWMNWMMGIGIGSTLLGGILSMFGIGGGNQVEGAGGKEPETRTEDEPSAKEKELEKKLQEVSAKAEQQAKEIAALKEAATQKEKAAVTTHKDSAEETTTEADSKLKDGSIVRVRDEKLGAQADISGTVTNNADGSISIKDRQNTYTYKQLGQKITYKGKEYPLYECTGAVDNASGQSKPISAQKYILVNGELIQPNDLNLSGSGLGTVKRAAQSAPPPNNHNSNIETTADEQSGSNNWSMLTPHMHSDGKFYSKPENKSTVLDTPWSKYAENTPSTNQNANANAKTNYNAVTLKDAFMQRAKGKLKNVKVEQNKDGSYQVWGYYKGNGILKTNANVVTVKDLNDPSLFDKLMEDYDSYFN